MAQDKVTGREEVKELRGFRVGRSSTIILLERVMLSQDAKF